jgi:integrase
VSDAPIDARSRPALFKSDLSHSRQRDVTQVTRSYSSCRVSVTLIFSPTANRPKSRRTAFRRGNQNLIPMELEDNHRHRRLADDEEKALLAAAPGHLRTLIIAALDTGMRRGEMLALTWSDVDAREGWLRLRGDVSDS